MMVKEKRGRGRERTEAADYFRFLLRMPEDMAYKFDALAKVNYVPMNATFLGVFREYLKTHEAEVKEALQELAEREAPPQKKARRAS